MKLSKERLKNLIQEALGEVMEEATAAEEKERMAKIMASFSDEELAAMVAEKEAEEGRPAMGRPGAEEPMSPQERHRQYLLKKHSNEGKKR